MLNFYDWGLSVNIVEPISTNKTKIRFWGCRGSFPTPDKDKIIYGGHTSCVEIRTSDNQIIILDMGSGLKRLGDKIINDSTSNMFWYIIIGTYNNN